VIVVAPIRDARFARAMFGTQRRCRQWDGRHDLDLVLPHNAAGLDDGAHDIAAQASAAWEAAVCWDDEYAIKRLAEVRAVWAPAAKREAASNAGLRRRCRTVGPPTGRTELPLRASHGERVLDDL
jgi:hypothetical protein